MLSHGLTCTETSRNSGCTAFGNREKSVQDTLACDKRDACGETFVGWSRDTDRPFLCKCQIFGGSVCELNGYDRFQNGVCSVRCCVDNCGFCKIRRNHGFMENGVCFLSFCDNRAGTYNISFFYYDVSVPFLFCVKRINADTS